MFAESPRGAGVAQPGWSAGLKTHYQGRNS